MRAEPAAETSGAPSVEGVLRRLSAHVGADGVERYFKHQTRLALGPGRLDVTVPTGFVAELIGRRFGTSLLEAAREELSRVDADAAGKVEVSFHVDGSSFGPSGRVAGARESGRDPEAAERAGRRAGDTAPSSVRGSGRGATSVAGLPCRHRLSDFVVGNSNRMAHAAAVRLAAKDCPKAYSPLVIHGSCGLGKTHLLQGITSAFRENHPGGRAVYTTAEAFTNEYIAAIKSGRVEQFRRGYRGVDLLCIDDVHFLASKEGTQSELLHTFDALSLTGARIVLASDEHVTRVMKLSKQLVSRFLAGMCVRLDHPEPDLREKIVERFAQQRGLRLDPAAVRLLARHGVGPTGLGGSVRDIEGDLTRVAAVAEVMPALLGEGGVAGLTLVRQALGVTEDGTGAGRPIRRPIRADQIVDHVCLALRVPRDELAGRGRHPRVVLARAAVAYLARTMTTLSYPEIARALGRPNHSTVVTAFQRISARVEAGEIVDPEGSMGLADVASTPLRDLLESMRHGLLHDRGVAG